MTTNTSVYDFITGWIDEWMGGWMDGRWMDG